MAKRRSSFRASVLDGLLIPWVAAVLAIVSLGRAVAAAEVAATEVPASTVQFNRDIRPILSARCFECHGPDAAARAADLRLDERTQATADRGDSAAVVPGDEHQSMLIARVTAASEDERMPPPSAGERLPKQEVELLRAWIRQGAKYEKHWAFAPLGEIPPPRGSSVGPGANPIDTFVRAKLDEFGLRPAPRAAPERLLRRVTLDLTGLPPTLAELEDYRADLAVYGEAVAHERAVDRLLGSIHFGEHLAVGWLDAARYADTNGYFGDRPRQMWLWRDWVINALNANLPFDQFTIEQLAGDLLPDASVQQRIATGFNRNHMANNESGIIDEEFRVEYVVDRVNTTLTTWLGITAGCAQCHDHKFDPISQREFYELFAFFNNLPEAGLIRDDDPPPRIDVPSAEQRQSLATLSQEARCAAEDFKPTKQQLLRAIAMWEQAADRSLPPVPWHETAFHESFDGELSSGATVQGSGFSFETGIRGQAAQLDATQHAEFRLEHFDPDGPWTIAVWLNGKGSLSCPWSLIEPAGDRRGIEMIWQKGRLAVHLVAQWGVSQIIVSTPEPLTAQGWHHVVVSYDGSRTAAGLKIFVDGAPAVVEVQQDTMAGSAANSEPLRIGRRDSGLGYYGLLDEMQIFAAALDEREVEDWYWGLRVRGILAVAAADRSVDDRELLLDYYIDRFADSSVRAAWDRIRTSNRELARQRESIPTALVMEELDQPRVTRVLERGQYDQVGEVVTPAVPAAIAAWPAGAPTDRLGFSQWLVSDQNPLTPRVAVNRLWQLCFGAGLVRTVDDFGSQGELPTHPELLDWLAATFRATGWDTKRMLRLIVTSETYCQTSRRPDSDAAANPEDRLLVRGPGGRLSAEELRDQALAVSGLLVRRVGGPSVKPYQPPGLWAAVSYNGEETYLPAADEGLWRRSLYTYVKRQAPPPLLLAFDGPTREKCTMARTTTNTPLQALVLLNDETFVEAARELASRRLAQAASDGDRLRLLWRSVLLREPGLPELELLAGLLQRQRDRFARDRSAAQRLVSVGASPADHRWPPSELAAWTVVAQTVLNLDEAITRP